MQAANTATVHQLYAAREAKAAADAAKLAGEHQHLIAGSGHVVAAKNIRIELKRAFPVVKFSVTSKSYSMGNSVDVSWTDGPTAQQVDQIINKYEAGSFDGMTDSYSYEDTVWNRAFGRTKYAHGSRSYSDKMLTSVIGRVVRQLGGIEQTPEQCVALYKNGGLWNVKQAGGCNVEREVNVALSRHTYCVTKA